jgi:hypothetical protein
MESEGLTYRQVRPRYGFFRTTVGRHISLARLAPDIQQIVCPPPAPSRSTARRSSGLSTQAERRRGEEIERFVKSEMQARFGKLLEDV